MIVNRTRFTFHGEIALRLAAPLSMPRFAPALLVAAIGLLPLQPALAQERPLAVLATVGMIADVAANVGGDCVFLITMMGPGIDPHLYQATARDVQRLQAAEVIFYAGHSLEGQLGDVLGRFAERTPTVAVAEAAIAPDELIAHEGAYAVDPHVWMDAGLWAQTVPVVAESLAALRPACATVIAANAARYAAELEALDAWAAASIASIPEAQRILVTAHDAFGYYGRAYGIEVVGIQGISTESEAGVADIRAMSALIADRRVPAVFVESTINPRTMQAVIDAVRQQGSEVTIGGQLYSDAMGDTGTPEGTYIGMIRANTIAIATALGGAPAPLPDALAAWAEHWRIAAP